MSTDLVLAPKNNRPKRVTVADRARRLFVELRLAIGHPITDLRQRLATWPGWDRPPATRQDAWRRSEILHTTRVPADSQLLIFFWQVSNLFDRFAFFALAIIVDRLTRNASPRARTILVGPLYHLAEHPVRRLTAVAVLVLCWTLAG
jgi:hypothetical protein